MKPQETQKNNGDIDLSHPSFAVVNLTRYQIAKEKNLYGSDIKHMNTISLKISTASTIRHSNKTWHRPKNQIIEVEMSEAQFGQMISSFNQGEGTPVTLRWLKGEGYMPDIELESLHQVFNNEMKASVKRQISKVMEAAKALRQALNEDKLGKKTLDPLVKDLEVSLQNMPSNLAFVDSSFQESMERATQAAKAEIEAFAQARERSQFQLPQAKDKVECEFCGTDCDCSK